MSPKGFLFCGRAEEAAARAKAWFCARPQLRRRGKPRKDQGKLLSLGRTLWEQDFRKPVVVELPSISANFIESAVRSLLKNWIPSEAICFKESYATVFPAGMVSSLADDILPRP